MTGKLYNSLYKYLNNKVEELFIKEDKKQQ